MTRKLLVLVAVVAMLSACGADSSASGGAVVARPLAYSLTGTDTMSYHAEMEVEMSITFGETLRRLDPSMPSTMSTEMSMGFDTLYSVAPGPEDGTYRVAMTIADIDSVKGKVDMGGRSMNIGDLGGSDLRTAVKSQMPEFVYIVDDKGAVIAIEAEGTTLDVEGLLGGTSSAGFSGGQMFGPELPSETVTVGDTWTTTFEQEIGDAVIVTEETHKVIRREEKQGRDTWVIRTDSVTDAYTINWDDMVELFAEVGGIQNVEGMEEMPPSFQMAMRSSPSTTTMLTWLDPERGEAVAVDVLVNMAMTMEMGGIPGLNGSFSMDMDGYTHMTMEMNE